MNPDVDPVIQDLPAPWATNNYHLPAASGSAIADRTIA